MEPTARAARGEPAKAAMSPYVATSPAGIRRTAASTRRAKGLGPARPLTPDHDPDTEVEPSQVVFVEDRCGAGRLVAERIGHR